MLFFLKSLEAVKRSLTQLTQYLSDENEDVELQQHMLLRRPCVTKSRTCTRRLPHGRRAPVGKFRNTPSQAAHYPLFNQQTQLFNSSRNAGPEMNLILVVGKSDDKSDLPDVVIFKKLLSAYFAEKNDSFGTMSLCYWFTEKAQ